MGDNPSPRQDEEVEVENNLGAGEQGSAEGSRDNAEPPPHERAPGEVLTPFFYDLTGADEDSPPDWEPSEDESEEEEFLALGDRAPRTRGQRGGVKAQRQRAYKAAAVARAVIAEAAGAAAGPQVPAAAAAAGAGVQHSPAQSAGVAAACAAPRRFPQFPKREQAELRSAGRSRSPAENRQEAERPRRSQSRRRRPSSQKADPRAVYTGRAGTDYRDWRPRGQYHDYGAPPAAKASRHRESSRPAPPPARTPSPSFAPPGKHWAPKVLPEAVRAPSSPPQRPAVSQLKSASGSETARVGAQSARSRAQSVSFKDRPEPRTPTTPPSPQAPEVEEESVHADLAYLEAQAQLANDRVAAAREAVKAAAEEKARLGIDRAIDHARRLDELRQLIRATDPNRPGASRRSVSPLPADIEGSLRNCSAERLAELVASFRSL